jgi:flagellar motility protein MotE (MotC chaperone)
MKLVVTTPRLLPMTIAAMAALLVVKSETLVRAAVPSSAEAAPPAATPPDAAPPAAAPPAPTPPAAAPAAAVKPAETKPAEAKPAEMKTADMKPGDGKPPRAKPADAGAAVPPKQDVAPPISESERALLLDLRKRSGELDAREAAIGAREAVLSAAETRLTRRLDELGALQKRLEALEAARSAHDEANWQGLVKLYESMKPRDAAVIFNDLDPSVLLPVLDRMKDRNAAQVLAAMLPDRARLATTELAQLRAHANAAPGAPAAPEAAIAKPPPAKTASGG